MKLRLLKTSIEIYKNFIIEAALKDLIDKLKSIGISNDIISYIENSPANLQGVAANEVLKNNNISILELDEKLSALKSKQEKIKALKEKSKIDIDVPEKYKKWFSNNINKYKDLNIVGNKDKIIAFFESGGYNPTNFTAKEILSKLEEKTEDPNINKFFENLIKKENDALSKMTNEEFAQYCKRRFEEFRREWKKKIIKELNNTGKSFIDLKNQQTQIYHDIQQGKYLDEKLPPTVLNHSEYKSLFGKLQILDAFIDENDIAYKKYSIDELIKKCIEWNKESIRSQKGKGLHYDPITIFAGPKWRNERFNGYVIIELKSVNDLKVEGLLLNHCTGDGTYDYDLGKSCRIFSIRDSSDINSPLCTFETNMDLSILRQCHGYKDAQPPKLYKDIAYELIKKNEKQLIEKFRNGDFSDLRNKDYENDDIRKIIISLAKEKNENAIEKLYPLYPDMRQAIIDLILKDKNEKAIEKLNSNYPDMREIVIQLVKQGNQKAIEKLDSKFKEMKQIIIDLVSQGNQKAIERLNPYDLDMKPIIMELATKDKNKFAIQKLEPSYDDMRQIIIDLAKEGNKYAIEIADLHNLKY